MDNQFVSRGGIKLRAALEQFHVDIQDQTVLDVGSSTGGFVDCLLQTGAKKVYALDTAYGELAWKLRNDPRVVVMERTNILFPDTWKVGSEDRQVASSAYSFQVDLITIDAGWTRLELILPIVKKFLKPEGKIIALLKPHYEAEKRDLVKGVLPSDKAELVKEQVIDKITNLGFKANNQMASPILGGGGNQEYLLCLTF